MNRLLVLLLLCGLPSLAQRPEAPEPRVSKKQVLLANLAMYGGSVLAAHATAFGSRQCLKEDLQAGTVQAFGLTGSAGGRLHPWRRSFSISLPADGAISLASYLLHKQHHDLMAVILPSGSAGMQVGIAGVLYAEGCI
jgi:hypothetical protein